MLETMANDLKKEYGELKKSASDYMMKELGLEDLFDTEPEGLSMLKRCYDFSDDYVEFMVEQAHAINRLNEKLDKILDLLAKS